jgi:hypothetical protein
MIRYLFPIFLFVGVLWWLKTLGRKGSGTSFGQGRPNEAPPPALPMVVCAQ